MLEVEEKFSFSNRDELEGRLRLQGYLPVREVTMVDWYFDRVGLDDGNENEISNSTNNELPLIRRDHWLRYRQVLKSSTNETDSNEGEWQLKRGTHKTTTSRGGATVYEEIEGIRAVEIAMSVISETKEAYEANEEWSLPTTFDGQLIPTFPMSGCDLSPFARIVTHRSQWRSQSVQDDQIIESVTDNANQSSLSLSTSHQLVVDLDTTPDGFAVGEVEALVATSPCSEEQDRAVAEARQNIQAFLSKLLNTNETENRRPPMGKLEQFLYRKQPRIYALCIESGVIPQRSVESPSPSP